MKNKIIINDKIFIFNEHDGCYEGCCKIWGNEVQTVIEVKDELPDILSPILSRLEWLNVNREKILDAFLKENSYFVDTINEMIDNKEFEVDSHITLADFRASLFILYLNFELDSNGVTCSFDLDAKPDYLLGHLAFMTMDKEYNIKNDGING